MSNPKKNADIFVGLIPSNVDMPDKIQSFSELQEL